MKGRKEGIKKEIMTRSTCDGLGRRRIERLALGQLLCLFVWPILDRYWSTSGNLLNDYERDTNSSTVMLICRLNLINSILVLSNVLNKCSVIYLVIGANRRTEWN